MIADTLLQAEDEWTDWLHGEAAERATKALPSPGAPLAPWPADMPVPITALDVTRALAAWDADVPAAAGLWAAQVVGRAGQARRKPV